MAERPCIQCGKCLEVCPLLRATDREELGPRAKATLAELVRTGAVNVSSRDAAELAGLCLGCHRCESACTQGVRPARAVARLRAKHPGFRSWLWKRWMEHPGFWRSAGVLSRVLPGVGETETGCGKPGNFSGLHRAAGLLRGLEDAPGFKPFLVVDTGDNDLKKEKITIFHGCVSSNVARSRRQAAEALLRAAGAELFTVRFDCCGGSLDAAGCAAEAASLRAANVAAWRAAGRPTVAVHCASCLHGLAAYAADGEGARADSPFESEDERRSWLDALTPISALLLHARFVVQEGAPEVAAYHRPCHAAEPDADARLLRRALGGSLRELPRTGCCGFGGILQLGAPGLSGRVAEDFWRRAAPEPGEVVLTGCSACALQLRATAPEGVRAGHWLDAVKIS